MKLWALADTHLGFGTEKPMDIFGKNWDGHPDLMAERWRELVAEDDVVLLAGDISWALRLDEVTEDLRFLNDLPGRKIIGRGNHDFWWQSSQKLVQLCEAEGFSSLAFLRNNAHRLVGVDMLDAGGKPLQRDVVVFGCRAWLSPFSSEWKQSKDEKYYERERQRLLLSLRAAERIRGDGDILVCMLHYPAVGPNGENSAFNDIIRAEGVSYCVHGHVHGAKGRVLASREFDGVRHYNTACDVIDFTPLRIGLDLST